MLRAYKYRIYPTHDQEIFFTLTFGCVRLVYNKMLEDRIKSYKEYKDGAKKIKYPTPSAYKTEYPFIKAVDSLALANAQMNLDKAYKNFFRDKSVGFPKFKSKKETYQSYTTNNQKGTIYIENGYLKLPKLKTMVKIKYHRPFEGLIKSATISKVPSGKYFVSILVDSTEPIIAKKNAKKVGLDTDITNFCITSDGVVYANPNHLIKSEKKLEKLQSELSRKKKGSNNRNKTRLKVAKLQEKIANQKSDFLHKLSMELINDNQVLVFEDLRVKNMDKPNKMDKAILGASWSDFRRMLEYKAKWYGREIIVANKNYAPFMGVTPIS